MKVNGYTMVPASIDMPAISVIFRLETSDSIWAATYAVASSAVARRARCVAASESLTPPVPPPPG